MPSQNFPISMCDDCTSSLLCTPPERSISLCSITAHQEMEGSNSPSSSILQAGQIQIPQHLLVCHVLQPPTTWAALLWVLSSFSLPFLHWGPKTGQSIIPRTASSRAIVTPLNWLATLLLIQLRMPLVSIAARTHCWLWFNTAFQWLYTFIPTIPLS